MSEERGALAPEDGATSRKESGLLKVPSRSSSNNQQSPTSTGLSGATANDHRNSIGGRSKDSKGSFLGRHRNGSASSRTAGGNRTLNTEGDSSQPSSPIQKRKKKKSGGILSFLGCCSSSPDDGNTTEGDGENVHKLQSIPQRPATSKSKASRTQTPPQDNQEPAANKPTNEKDASGAAALANNSNANGNEEQTMTDGDRITPVAGNGNGSGNAGESSSGQQAVVAPAVTVEPPASSPTGDNATREAEPDVGSGEPMEDVVTEDNVNTVPEENNATTSLATGSSPAPTEPQIPDDVADEEPRYLLPEILPEHKGRKCLVLDLDETLVHSSFKVRRRVFAY